MEFSCSMEKGTGDEGFPVIFKILLIMEIKKLFEIFYINYNMIFLINIKIIFPPFNR